MKYWLVAASSAFIVAGCGSGAGTGNSAVNAVEAPSSAVAPSNGAAPTPAAPAATAANVAIGRWVQASGRCDELADVEFTPTVVRMFGGPGGSSFDIPITYDNITATSVTLQAGPGQPTTLATLTDPTHLTLTSPERPERNCVLVRR